MLHPWLRRLALAQLEDLGQVRHVRETAGGPLGALEALEDNANDVIAAEAAATAAAQL